MDTFITQMLTGLLVEMLLLELLLMIQVHIVMLVIKNLVGIIICIEGLFLLILQIWVLEQK